MIQIVKDIEALQRKAARLGLIPVVRLNGTSDIRWETVKFDYTLAHDKTRTVTIFELFPDVQFLRLYKAFQPQGYSRQFMILTFSFFRPRSLPHTQPKGICAKNAGCGGVSLQRFAC